VPVREQQSERGLAHDHNGRMAHTLASRSDTTFSTVPGFVRDYDAFSIVEQASIGRYMNRFEVDFQISTMDMELRNGYQIEVHETNPYKLWQIYLRRAYRSFVFFRKELPEAYWIALFRKGKQREQREIEIAKERAKMLWKHLQEN